MPKTRAPDELGNGDQTELHGARRLLAGFSRRNRSLDRVPAPLSERLRNAMLKPPKPGSEPAPAESPTVEELEETVQSATDKERLIGLLAAPWAAGIGIIITDSLISHDPAARLANGQLNKLHVSIGLYHELMLALVVLAVLMLVMAWLRKRLYLGMVLALYGLAVFNLHYWGFGIPFIMGGAWYLVRSYRFQKSLKLAKGDPPEARPPRASKRYTPPASRARR